MKTQVPTRAVPADEPSAAAVAQKYSNTVKHSMVLAALKVFSAAKTSSGEDYYISAGELTEELNNFDPGIRAVQKTVKGILDDLAKSFETLKKSQNQTSYHLLRLSYGGEVIAIDAPTEYRSRGKKSANPQTRYYFKPLLTWGENEMLTASIVSNQYLSESDKDFLVSRLSIPTFTPNPYKLNLKNNPIELPEHKQKTISANKQYPKDLLQNINTLYRAIQSSCKVDLIYGTYSLGKNNKVSFQKLDTKPFPVNPYAMLWNQGHYYLLATKHEEDELKFRMYRVERIHSVRLRPDPEDATKHEKRESVPKELRPYFKNKIFDSVKYNKNHPVMSIYLEEGTETCSFTCLEEHIKVAVDYFGTELRISKEAASDRYKITVDTQYESVRLICLHHPELFTPVYPQRLVEDCKSFR